MTTTLALPPDLAPTLRQAVEQLIAECTPAAPHPARQADDPQPARRWPKRRRTSHHRRGKMARVRP